MAVFSVNEQDLRMAEIYRDFLPKQVFDAHAHIHLAKACPTFSGPKTTFSRAAATPEDYKADMAPVLPGVEVMRLNMLPMVDPVITEPSNGLRKLGNDHVRSMQERYPDNVFSPYIVAADDARCIDALTSHPGARGIKCYAYGAGKPDYESLAVGEYLPEAAWEVANAKGLPITLHLFRRAALADPENFAYINTMAKKYPNAKLILAHCARGFAAWPAVKMIRQLEDCGNIWFDMAAVCESGPMMACILKNAGKRTMWGSDYPICFNRGRAISLGAWQTWLGDAQCSELDRGYVAGENLMAFYQAALLLDLDQTQIDDIFYNNAIRLFGLHETVH